MMAESHSQTLIRFLVSLLIPSVMSLIYNQIGLVQKETDNLHFAIKKMKF